MKNQSKWLPISEGLRQNLITKKFEACKRINGKRKWKTFKQVSEAKRWLRGEYKEEHKEGALFCEFYSRYKDMTFINLAIATRGIKEQKMRFILSSLGGFDIAQITHLFLDVLISSWKQDAINSGNQKRMSFDKELDEIKALLNWYRLNYNPLFSNPVMPRHYNLGRIKESVAKKKALNQEQLVKFFNSFTNELYRDFAITQYLCASRWSEIASLLHHSIDFHNKELDIKYAVIEDQSKRYAELDDLTKNDDTRKVSLAAKQLFYIAKKYRSKKHHESDFLFHTNGKPIKYRQVQYHYNKALKRAGLADLFSSTHIMRYSMATEAMRIFGTIDHVKAATGHKSDRLAQHYSQVVSPLQREVVQTISEKLSEVFQATTQSGSSS